MASPDFDLATANRWFAIEMNNQAWDLIEQSDRSSEETEMMLHAAHAACIHWREVGQPINDLRALCLLLHTYLAAEDPARALGFAQRCLALSEENPEGQNDFDRSTIYLGAARAHAATGNMVKAQRWQQQAIDLAMRLTEEQGKDVVMEMLARGNQFGLETPEIA